MSMRSFSDVLKGVAETANKQAAAQGLPPLAVVPGATIEGMVDYLSKPVEASPQVQTAPAQPVAPVIEESTAVPTPVASPVIAAPAPQMGAAGCLDSILISLVDPKVRAAIEAAYNLGLTHGAARASQ